jgi:ketosteroid isomerase-like protein
MFYEAFLARDVDALVALYVDDAVNHQVPEEPLHGKAEIRRGFERFFAAFPDERTDAVAFYEDGEWGMWEWRGGPPGKPGAVHGCGFFHVREGKIVLQRGYWDRLTFLRVHDREPDDPPS